MRSVPAAVRHSWTYPMQQKSIDIQAAYRNALTELLISSRLALLWLIQNVLTNHTGYQ